MTKRRSGHWADWLGFNRIPDVTKARWLGGLISVLITITVIGLAGLVVVEFFLALTGLGNFEDSESQSAAIRNIGLVFAAIVGVPFVIWRSVVAQKQVDVAEQGHITDRINTAVEGLGAEKTISYRARFVIWQDKGDENAGRAGFMQRWGEATDIRERLPDRFRDVSQNELDSAVEFGAWTDITETKPNLEVRIGAIYALERIAQDSDRDHVQIMEILCAYIRQNAPDSLAEPFPEGWAEAMQGDADGSPADMPKGSEIRNWAGAFRKPREDIQVALRVLGRRSSRQIALEGHKNAGGDWQGYRLDLRNTCLQGADMTQMRFDNTLFDKAQMQGAYLRWAQMQGANLGGAQMQGADLRLAQLDDATSLSLATLRGVWLREVDLTEVTLSENQVKSIFGDGSVILPGGVTPEHPDWPAHFAREKLKWDDFDKARDAWWAEIGFDPGDPATW